MTDVGEFVENFLKHEYDPVKAREYYLRTRKLKGRKPGSAKPTDPRSKVGYNGKPLKPLGKRMEEDETPDKSPSGAKLVDYDGSGLGKATYADGTVYDARKGWTRTNAAGVAAAKTQVDANRARAGVGPKFSAAEKTRRISQAESKLIRARTLANKVKDPKKKEAILSKLRKSEERLRRIESATHRKRSQTA